MLRLSARAKGWSGDEVRWDGHLVDHKRWAGVLRRPAARPLVDHYPAVLDQLPAPHSPRLGALDSPGEACLGERALASDRLRASDVEWGVGEEQVGEGAVAVGAARPGDA